MSDPREIVGTIFRPDPENHPRTFAVVVEVTSSYVNFGHNDWGTDWTVKYCPISPKTYDIDSLSEKTGSLYGGLRKEWFYEGDPHFHNRVRLMKMYYVVNEIDPG